ncbi:MAG: hypothetical protein ACRDMV_03495 [Streptosporangiales bacterium]
MELGETGDQPSAPLDDTAGPDAAPVEQAGPATEPGDAPDAERAMPASPDTGDARVDDAVRPLADLGDQPSGEHVEAYEQAHGGLQETLAELDKRAEDDREGG